MTSNSFIANVNKLVLGIEDIKSLNASLDAENIATLLKLSRLDLATLAEDLNKQTYLGNKKITIDLLKNYVEYDESLSEVQKKALYNNSTCLVRYSSMQVLLSDNTIKVLYFSQNDNSHYVTTNEELYTQLLDLMIADNGIEGTRIVLVPSLTSDYEVLITDMDGHFSNVTKVTLNAVVGDGYKEQSVSYAWADYTSTLQLCLQYIEELVIIANHLDNFLEAPDEVQSILDECNDVLVKIEHLQLLINQDKVFVGNKLTELNSRADQIENFVSTSEGLVQEVTQLVAISNNNVLVSGENRNITIQKVEESTELAAQALTSKEEAEIWAEGNDDEVNSLGGVHSSKRSAERAYKIANAPVDEQLEDGDYSAKHYSTLSANKALEALTSEENAKTWVQGTDEEIVLLGGTHSAKRGAELANKAANELEDVPLENGEFSAKHYYLKAKEQADLAAEYSSGGLPPATEVLLGGVRIGKGISVDKTGLISVDEYTIATDDKAGIVRIGSGITIFDGSISVKEATESNTGIVSLATNEDIANGNNTTKAVTPKQLIDKITALIESAPDTLDTLNKLATALGNDPNFAATITTAIANKWTATDATTTEKGIVQLDDTVASESTTKAATANAVKQAYDLADDAVAKSGDTMTGNLKVPSLELTTLTFTESTVDGRKVLTIT